MSDTNLVSIILPVCNAEVFLEAALQSLHAQTHTNFEVIAIDDASRDNSYKILRAMRKKDSRFRVYKNVKRYGIAVSLNRALKRAKGSYIAFMDASAVSTRLRLKKQLTYLLEHPKTVAIGAATTLQTMSRKKAQKSQFPTTHTDIFHGLLLATTLNPFTLMINRRLFPKDVLYFKQKKYPFVYTEALIKLCNYGEVANVEQILVNVYKKENKAASKLQDINHSLSFVKLWVKSFTESNAKPSLRSLFTPLVRQA